MSIDNNRMRPVELTIVHQFNAPKKLVFDAFSNAEALGEWWGPVECKTTVLKLDFRKGGIFHYKMEMDGNVSYGRFEFGRIKPHDIIEFTNSFSDEKGNIIRAPFDIQLPLRIFYHLNFTENNDRTTIIMTGQAVNATEREILALKSIHANVQAGFGASFNKLSSYLSNPKTNFKH